MTFVTRLTLRSGDRNSLDKIVGDIKRSAEKKGVRVRGPHTPPPQTYRAPQYKRLDDIERKFPPWEYNVYERWIEISGHDASVRRVRDIEFPKGIHVEVEVLQVGLKK